MTASSRSRSDRCTSEFFVSGRWQGGRSQHHRPAGNACSRRRRFETSSRAIGGLLIATGYALGTPAAELRPSRSVRFMNFLYPYITTSSFAEIEYSARPHRQTRDAWASPSPTRVGLSREGATPSQAAETRDLALVFGWRSAQHCVDCIIMNAASAAVVFDARSDLESGAR